MCKMKTNPVAKLWISPARRYIGLHACPCGYYGDPIKPCTCSSSTVTRYQKRISGPLLDRIDIHVEVPQVKFREIAGDRTGDTSAQIRERVVAARKRQHQRSNGKQRVNCSAHMGPKELKEFCALDESTKELLQMAMAELNLSARAYDRILKVARTIADLAESDCITADHIGEAIQFRSLDRQIWG